MTKARNVADLGSNDVIETTSTGVDVTGTVTADGLTVGQISGDRHNINITDGRPEHLMYVNNYYIGSLSTNDSDNINGMTLENDFGAGVLIKSSASSADSSKGNAKKSLFVKNNNDVEFYEDTGSTPKMTWDASAEKLLVDGVVELDGSNPYGLIRLARNSDSSRAIGLRGLLSDDSTNGAYLYYSGGAGSGLELASTFMSATVAGSERARIDASGNVGIGTDSPDAKLTVSGDGTWIRHAGYGQLLDFGNWVDGEARIESTNADLSFRAAGAYPIKFVTNGSERARIDSSGKLLIGKTTDFVGTQGVRIDPNGAFYASILEPSNTYHVYNSSSSAYTFYVNANGGISNYQANNVNLSDKREKKDIESLGSTWDAVSEWNLVKFKYKSDKDNDFLKFGVIAQDIQETHPELVTSFEVDENTERLAVKEQQMYWMAIKALQEALTEIDNLKQRVDALENK